MPTPTGHVPVTLGCASSRSLELGPVTVVEARFPPRAVLPRHSHERGSVAVMIDGSFDLDLGTTSRSCTPTAVFTEPAGSSHTNRIGLAGAHVVVVQPDPADEDFFRPFACLLKEQTHRHHAGVAARASRLAGELAAADDLGALAAEGLVIDMLVTLARLGPGVRRQPPGWLRRTQELLHARFGETVRLADLAREVGMHPAHVARAFKHHFGVTVGTYVRRLRLDWAAVELARSDTSLAQMAQAAGFADQSHFTRAFRRYTGFTPSVYRRTRRG